MAGIYDYGHYGLLLKDNIRAQWLKSMIQLREDVVGLDSAIFMHPATWKASGHVDGFNDPQVDCRNCKSRFRADHRRTAQRGSHLCGCGARTRDASRGLT